MLPATRVTTIMKTTDGTEDVSYQSVFEMGKAAVRFLYLSMHFQALKHHVHLYRSCS